MSPCAAKDAPVAARSNARCQSDRAVIDAAVAAHRALVTLDLDFADPVRFPPGETSGLIVLRVRTGPVVRIWTRPLNAWSRLWIARMQRGDSGS
jgi:hypothetical protein